MRVAYIVLLVAAGGLWAQTVSVSPSNVKRGRSGSLLIKLEASAAKPVVALQWRLYFPSGTAVAPADMLAGSAAEAAGKSITCVAIKDVGAGVAGGGYACIVAGGRKSIGSGAVAVVLYHVGTNVATIGGRVRVEKIAGVSVDGKQVDMPNAEGIIKLE